MKGQAMKNYTFAYGKGAVTLPLDERGVIAELHGNDVPAIADIPAALAQSLDAPIDSAPLCARVHAGDKVALVVSDMSRFWMRQDLVVPHLVDYLTERCGVREEDITIVIANGTHIGGDEQELRTLVTDAVYDRIKVKNHDCEAKDLVVPHIIDYLTRRCGARDADITIVIANGTHVGGSPDELRRLVTPEVYARVRVVNHDCAAPNLVYLGDTPHGTPVRINRDAALADIVICLGACTHHVMAGFGGGRKSILPGISGRETIFHNHAFSLNAAQLRSNPAIGNGALKGNPLHEDMCEAASLVNNLFMVNLVMNADMKLSYIFSGHYLTSWERACTAVDDIYRVDIPCRADAVSGHQDH